MSKFNLPATVDAYAWPGGYPIAYLCADGESLCPKCVNENRQLVDDADESDKQWLVVAQFINWEDTDLICANCNCRIESAYGDDESEAINLDGMSVDPADYIAYAENKSNPSVLRQYAMVKSTAMHLRLTGDIRAAQSVESKLEQLYDALPSNLQW